MEKTIVKFRAKKLGSEEWVYGIPFTKVENEFADFHAMHVCDDTGYWGIAKIQPETLGQFSGIENFYAGDHVSLVDIQGVLHTGTVVFQDGMFALEWYPVDSEEPSLLPLAWACHLCTHVERIGTIWDTAEEGVTE